MKAGSIASFLSLAAFAAASDVLSLTQDTFSKTAEEPLSLIEFFAPW